MPVDRQLTSQARIALRRVDECGTGSVAVTAAVEPAGKGWAIRNQIAAACRQDLAVDWRSFRDTYRIIRTEDGWYLYRTINWSMSTATRSRRRSRMSFAGLRPSSSIKTESRYPPGGRSAPTVGLSSRVRSSRPLACKFPAARQRCPDTVAASLFQPCRDRRGPSLSPNVATRAATRARAGRCRAGGRQQAERGRARCTRDLPTIGNAAADGLTRGQAACRGCLRSGSGATAAVLHCWHAGASDRATACHGSRGWRRRRWALLGVAGGR
jgi:hypothetical protein